MSASDLAPSIDQLTGRGLVSMEAGVQRETSPLTLTGQGQSALGRLRAARSQELTALLDGCPLTSIPNSRPACRHSRASTSTRTRGS